MKDNYGSAEKQFDVIYDIVGNENELYTNSHFYLKPNGSFYAIGIDIGTYYYYIFFSFKSVDSALFTFYFDFFLKKLIVI